MGRNGGGGKRSRNTTRTVSQQNRLRRKAIPRPDVLQFRNGFSNVTEVQDFHNSYLTQIKCNLPKDFFDYTTPRPKEWAPLVTPKDRGHLDVSDLVIPSPFERIQSAIETALTGWDRETGNDDTMKQEKGCRKRKRSHKKGRGDNKRRRPVQDLKNARYIKYAQTCEVPNYERMLRPWASIQECRKCHKVVKVKREMNTLTHNVITFRLKGVAGKDGVVSIPADTIIVAVSVFHHQRAVNKFTRSHEYLLLGDQTLGDLRDSIECLSDKIMLGPSIKNGFFFIEDTFYDDLRHQDAVRLSQPICDWVREENRFRQPGLNRYSQKTMSETRIVDLKFRLGAHYLYRHQGDCDHIIVFNELRTLETEDIQNRNAYPFMTFQQIARRQKCGVCEIYPAKYVTYGDPLTSSNPFFFCEKCYHPFHFNREGVLLYDNFHVYPYIHD